MSEGTIQTADVADVPRSNAAQPFGKYLLQERIGSGGMAEVFRAIAVGPEGFQRTVVIKRILPHLSQDASFVRMFIDEAKISGLLSHPNLVQIFEFGKVNDSFFIAMEHVHGRTLSSLQMRLVEVGRLPAVAASAEIGRQICCGLAYAHGLASADGKGLGIVHRDISPSNVMLAFHGGVKILDFGIARVADGLRQVRTQVGALKGKVSYMSPEQIQLDEIDHRSDIFAVGIVLHELLTRRRLFRGSSDFTATRKVLELEIPLPSSLNPLVPPALDRVVMRALDRDRDARYGSAAEMGADLDRLMQELHMSPREHVALLNEIFPDQAAPITDAANMFAVATAPADGSAYAKEGDGARHAEGDSRSNAQALPFTPAVTAPASRTGQAPPDLAATTTGPGGVPSSVSLGGARSWLLSRRKPLTGVAVAVMGLALWWAWPASAPKTAAHSTPPSATDSRKPAAAGAGARVKTVVQCSLDSSPQDASVTRVDSGEVMGRTPFTVTLLRSDQVIVFRFEKAGHAPALYKVIPDLDKAVRVDLAREPRAPEAVHARTAAATSIARKPSRRDTARRVSKSVREATPIDPFTM